jgi:hypothetical protein
MGNRNHLRRVAAWRHFIFVLSTWCRSASATGLYARNGDIGLHHFDVTNPVRYHNPRHSQSTFFFLQAIFPFATLQFPRPFSLFASFSVLHKRCLRSAELKFATADTRREFVAISVAGHETAMVL